MDQPGYRQYLRSSVAASAAPHGYTLALWTTGAIATRAEGTVPGTVDALLLLAGAAVAFGLVGASAFGGINRVLAPFATDVVRIWGGMHLPSVGIAIVLVSLLTLVVHGHLLWPLVGFTATVTYLLVLGGQFWLAARHGPSSGPAAELTHGSQ